MRDRIPLAALLGMLASICASAPVELTDGDMEQAGVAAWRAYGTPTILEKVAQAHGGKQALRVVTDNQKAMGGGFEGVSRGLGTFQAGDRIRVSFWLRPVAGREVWVGIGRTSFEQIWRLFDTDWMPVVCDFRVRVAGHHSIWITQQGAPNEFLIDDVVVERIPELDLGRADEDEMVAVENAGARFWFCRTTGAACGIENLSTGEVVAPLRQRRPLFGIGVLRADGLAIDDIRFDQARLAACRPDPGRQHLELEFIIDKPGLRVTCQISAGDTGAIAFSGRVENRSDTPVLDFTYPVIDGIRPARDPTALTLVHPYLCGQIVPHALTSTGCSTTYPGRGVMGWLDLAGEAGGLAMLVRDPSRTGTRLTALPTAREDFDLALTKEVRIPPGATWKAPVHEVFLHAGDWHAAADRYRQWARQAYGPPDTPQWLRDADGWVLTGVQNGIPFWRLPHIYRSAQWMGIDYLHVQGQGIDNMWFDETGKRRSHAMTFPYPSPQFGTPDELTDAVREIHGDNGHVMFYFLYERWTPSLSNATDLGSAPRTSVPDTFAPPPPSFFLDNGLVQNPGGRLPRENPHMVERAMCLGAPGWQEWMRHWAIDIYAKRYGADGFYWDVMGRNGPFRCFNSAHGHAGENRWAAGSATVLERTLREGRAINPDFSCAIEGCQDSLGPWVGFHLMSGGTKTPEVFRYTFPELCLVDGFSNHTWKWSQPEKARRVFLCGERFDTHGYHAQVRPLVWLRKRVRPFIDWPARFVDTVGLSVSHDDIQARRFVRDDGGNRAILVTVLNESGRRDATLRVDLGPLSKVVNAAAFLPDGSIRPLLWGAVGGREAKLAVPATPVSALLLVERVEPALQVVATLDQIRTPGIDGVEATLFFPAGRPTRIRTELRGPDGPKLVPATVPGTGYDAVERHRWVPSSPLATHQEWSRITVAVSWDGGKAQPWCMFCPPLANPGFETVRKDGRLDYWPATPCSDDPAEGRHCLKLVKGDGHGHVRLLTPIKPSAHYRLSARIRRDVAGSSARVSMIEYEEKSRFRASASIGSGGKAGVWESFSTDFVSHEAPRTSSVFLYLGNSTTAWFDDLRLEEVPPH